MKKPLLSLLTPALASLTLLASTAMNLTAQDSIPDIWASFGGPTDEFLVPKLPEKLYDEPKLLWEHPIKGQCYGPIAADQELVVVPDHDGAMDYWYAYDAKSGEEKWTYEMENGQDMDFGASPRAMPVFHEGKVFIMNAFGRLVALNREDGSVVWEKDLMEDFGGPLPIWGFCATPEIIEKGLLINPGSEEFGIVCLNPDNGEVVWKTTTEMANYSSFLVEEFGGKKQVITYDDSYLLGLDAETGEKLWEYETSASSGYIVPTPVKVGEDKLLLMDDEHGARLFTMVDGKLDEDSVVENFNLLSELTTPVVFNDLGLVLYYELLAFDPTTLEILWRIDDHDPYMTGSYGIFFVDKENNRVLSFSASGAATLLKVSREGGEIISNVQLTEPTEVGPALIGNRIYARDNNTNVYAYELWEESGE